MDDGRAVRHRTTVRRLTLYLVGSALMLGAALGLGYLAARVIGYTPGAQTAVLAVAAVTSVWLSRLMLCALWWADTGVWDWRRTRLLRAIRAGWGGPR
jgi:hypothetical protein